MARETAQVGFWGASMLLASIKPKHKKHMKTNTVIQIRIIDPMGKKISASELIDANCSHPITQAFYQYRERHRGELVGEWMLAGEGVW